MGMMTSSLTESGNWSFRIQNPRSLQALVVGTGRQAHRERGLAHHEVTARFCPRIWSAQSLRFRRFGRAFAAAARVAEGRRARQAQNRPRGSHSGQEERRHFRGVVASTFTNAVLELGAMSEGYLLSIVQVGANRSQTTSDKWWEGAFNTALHTVNHEVTTGQWAR